MRNKVVILDVREEIAAGREPFSKIMAAVGALKPGQDLRLIAPFEPRPLLQLLSDQGFGHDSRQTASGDWEVLFSRNHPGQPSLAAPPRTRPSASAGTEVDLDVRGLEPPQPMVGILEALATLPPGATLRARTDRRPMHLYSQLESRGFTGESAEQPDGSFITKIRHS